jgi:hypothetical protein
MHTQNEMSMKKNDAQQKHIKELRKKLNAKDPNEIQPFTKYKMITYLCVIVLPLVPYAIFRLWTPNSEFGQREKYIWTALIILIALYMIKFTFFNQ